MLFWIGLIILILGLVSLVVPIPRSEREGVTIGQRIICGICEAAGLFVDIDEVNRAITRSHRVARRDSRSAKQVSRAFNAGVKVESATVFLSSEG